MAAGAIASSLGWLIKLWLAKELAGTAGDIFYKTPKQLEMMRKQMEAQLAGEQAKQKGTEKAYEAMMKLMEGEQKELRDIRTEDIKGRREEMILQHILGSSTSEKDVLGLIMASLAQAKQPMPQMSYAPPTLGDLVQL